LLELLLSSVLPLQLDMSSRVHAVITPGQVGTPSLHELELYRLLYDKIVETFSHLSNFRKLIRALIVQPRYGFTLLLSLLCELYITDFKTLNIIQG